MPFADAVDFQEGPGIMAYDFQPEGVPLIRLAGLEKGRNLLDGCNYLDPAKVAAKWSHFRLAVGDVLLSTSASLGRTAVVPSAAAGAVAYTGIIRMRPRDGRLHPAFIPYMLESPHFQRQVEAMGAGSVLRHFGPSHLRHMTAVLPPLPEQKRIAHILGTLDDKIELNRRMCQTLEEMARALFKSWFVDFDPVRAKAEGRQPAGMDAATAALFPDSFVDSKLGPIPEGWEVRSLGDEFEVTMGQSPPGQTYNSNGDGLPFYQGRADFGFRFPALRIYCTAPTRLANKGDTLLSVRAPVGDLNVALFNCAIGRGVAALRHRSGAASYTYHSLQAHQDDLLLFEANGTVFGSVSGKELAAVRLVAPPDVLAKQFATAVGPLDDEIENRTVQSQGLANARDALLPRLLGREERQG